MRFLEALPLRSVLPAPLLSREMRAGLPPLASLGPVGGVRSGTGLPQMKEATDGQHLCLYRVRSALELRGRAHLLPGDASGDQAGSDVSGTSVQ